MWHTRFSNYFLSTAFLCADLLLNTHGLPPQAIAETSGSVVIEDEHPESVGAPSDTTSVEMTAPVESVASERMDVNRPWEVQIPAGPTAFVLEQREFQAGLYKEHITNSLSVGGPLSVRYGLTENITIGVGTPFEFSSFDRGRLLLVEGKWNFLNSGSWSFALRPWFGYHIAADPSKRDGPLVAELIASRVLSDSLKLHLIGAFGKNTRDGFHSYSYASTDTNGNPTNHTSENRNTNLYNVVRSTAALEWRMHRRHGITFSISPQYRWNEYQYSSPYMGGSGVGSDRYTDMGMTAGVSYHYLREHFGFALGVEMGPTWHSNHYIYSYSSGSGSYTNQDNRWSSLELLGMSSVSAAVDYRF